MKNTWYTGRGHRDSFFECLNYLLEPKTWCHLQLLSLQRDRKTKTTKTALTPSQVQHHASVSTAMSLPRSRGWESALGGPLDTAPFTSSMSSSHVTEPQPSDLRYGSQICPPCSKSLPLSSSSSDHLSPGPLQMISQPIFLLRSASSDPGIFRTESWRWRFTSLSGLQHCSSAADLQYRPSKAWSPEQEPVTSRSHSCCISITSLCVTLASLRLTTATQGFSPFLNLPTAEPLHTLIPPPPTLRGFLTPTIQASSAQTYWHLELNHKRHMWVYRQVTVASWLDYNYFTWALFQRRCCQSTGISLSSHSLFGSRNPKLLGAPG